MDTLNPKTSAPTFGRPRYLTPLIQRRSLASNWPRDYRRFLLYEYDMSLLVGGADNPLALMTSGRLKLLSNAHALDLGSSRRQSR